MSSSVDMYEKEMYDKILSGEKLHESDLRELREFGIEEVKGDNRRWSRSMKTYLQLCDKYFALEWEQGLTEYQEDSFDEQPYEVTFTEEIITKTIKKWHKV